MNIVTAKPKNLKQANLSLIRKVIKNKGSATRAEIALETAISVTTVRAILTEMLADGEILEGGLDESCGGRKAVRYRFQPNRYYGVTACYRQGRVRIALVNICGEVLNAEEIDSADDEALFDRLDRLTAEHCVKSIGIGVQGVVDGKSYIKKQLDSDVYERDDLGARLEERYGVPVIMENDVNATAVGCGLCLQKEQFDLVFIHFEKGCVCAGVLVKGKVVRGHDNFAGELGLIPLADGKLLDARIAEPLSNEAYTRLVSGVVNWICGLLNPECVVLAGTELRSDCVEAIQQRVKSSLPPQARTQVLYAPDEWGDYVNGMARLTADNIFDEVHFIKEQP